MSDPPTLEQSYATCRKLNRRYGTTYYWATEVLPSCKRHHVHALYGFCRFADEIVDALDESAQSERASALAALRARFLADLEAGESTHPVLRAVVHTANAFRLDASLFERFLTSMEMDLTVTEYQTWEDLCAYMDGSAAVIGEMVLPILEPSSPAASRPARTLGVAFQLTNFLRDVGEDLDRGRTYIPQDDLERFDAAEPLRQRRVTPQWVQLMTFEVERARALYLEADEGVSLLRGRSRAAISSARTLYSQILDRIELAGYDVFSQRCRVPLIRKLAVVGAEAAGALSPSVLRRAAVRPSNGSSMP